MTITAYYSKTGEVDSAVLDDELRSANIPIEGIGWEAALSRVKLDYLDSATPVQMAQGEALVVAHVSRLEAIRLIIAGAREQAANIPDWAHWDETTANAWGQTNIGTPLANARASLEGMALLNLTTFKAAMRTVLDILDKMWTLQQALARMTIALRNQNWPNLQN